MFHGGPRMMLMQETSKPKRTSETLARLGWYFRAWWPMLALAGVLVVLSTWTQVTTPELTGQLVDCFLTPSGAAMGGTGVTNFMSSGEGQAAGSSQSNCWLTSSASPRGMTQTVIKAAFFAGGYQAPGAQPSTAERLNGLVRMVIILVVLYISSSLLTGATFFSMTWAGQHVLRDLRTAVFEHLHRLPVSYYAEHEAGDLMSRITNDTETIGQAINFALVNVASGILLLVWIAYNMLAKSIPFALLSMVVVPLMAVATTYFSNQARKAFRKPEKRWATSTRSCRRASRRCGRCRRSTGRKRTSSNSNKPMPLTGMPTSGRWRLPAR